ncbi:MAG: hypothetical protein A3J83_03290 [Elusimicrobia bacterium RIFOXYA2_FULL_40_6]|nr:MAG: hypothetical protein A3J83_03290 [Elusimicrobia bacterium RIFOXYA2_FULL_40_6]
MTSPYKPIPTKNIIDELTYIFFYRWEFLRRNECYIKDSLIFERKYLRKPNSMLGNSTLWKDLEYFHNEYGILFPVPHNVMWDKYDIEKLLTNEKFNFKNRFPFIFPLPEVFQSHIFKENSKVKLYVERLAFMAIKPYLDNLKIRGLTPQSISAIQAVVIVLLIPMIAFKLNSQEKQITISTALPVDVNFKLIKRELNSLYNVSDEPKKRRRFAQYAFQLQTWDSYQKILKRKKQPKNIFKAVESKTDLNYRKAETLYRAAEKLISGDYIHIK